MKYLAKRAIVKVGMGAITPCMVLIIWYAASLRGGTLIPSIGSVVKILIDPTGIPCCVSVHYSIGYCAMISLLRVAIGYSCAVLLAVPLGLLVGRVQAAMDAVSLLVNMVRVVSPLAWMPVAILIFGATTFAEIFFGDLHAYEYEILNQLQPAMVLIVGWGAFFAVLIATINAASSVRKSLVESALMMGANWWQRFYLVVLPYALPQIIAGCRIGLGVSWMAIVATELYPGTQSGLGYLIFQSLDDCAQYDYTFAAIIYIMVIGLVLNGLLRALEKYTGHWQARQL